FISSSGVSPVASGNDAWNLGLGINLPIWWQKQRAQVLEGNAQILSSVEEYSALRNTIFFELEDALVKIDTQYRQAVLFRDLIVPRAWQAVEASTSSYRAGALEFTALIENWRKWLDFALAYHRALAGVEQRFADLEQLVGVALPRLPAQPAAGTSEPVSGSTPAAGATRTDSVAGGSAAAGTAIARAAVASDAGSGISSSRSTIPGPAGTDSAPNSSTATGTALARATAASNATSRGHDPAGPTRAAEVPASDSRGEN
ncbi:MAG: hypothetical protein D6760_12370, partial [Deltaproteobacteria bacterium]